MSIEIRPYTEDWIPAVREFNERMRPARGQFKRWRLETTPSPFPKGDGRKFSHERFLAIDGSHVRGSYAMNWQEASFRGEILPVASFALPITEGAVDRHFSLVGIELVRDALRRSALLFGLGLGGHDRPIAKILGAMGWSMRSVPFYFKVKNAARFLWNVRPLRRGRLVSVAMDAVALSGVGQLAAWTSSAVLGVRHKLVPSPSVELVEAFSDWADELWKACHRSYSMIAVRDQHVLNILYPPESDQYIRLKVRERGRLLGWAVVSETSELAEFFGSMRVGLIMDGLARPEDASQVLRAATRALEERGVDLIVSTQSHPAWRAGLRDAGFFRGPSDCLFAASKALAEKLRSIDPHWAEIHVNRDSRPR